MMRLCFVLFVCALLICPAMVAGQGKDREIKVTWDKESPVKKIVSPTKGKVKNVVFMIGDGMSLMTMYSTWAANRGKLNIENCRCVGLAKTYCYDRLITDSGASGTALATGHKTRYHSVGVDPDGKPLTTLTDLAAAKKKSTGVVVTCRLNDATPAAFCAHNSDREQAEAIIADYVGCGVDFIFGGGKRYFCEREDGRDIMEEMRALGYRTPENKEQLDAIESGKVLAVWADHDLPRPAERGEMLTEGTLKALELLSRNKKGFFLMVEASQIDDYGHSNQLRPLVEEVLDFDRTIGKVFEWAAADGNTLVVVTADHETGGLALVGGDLERGEIVGKFSTGSHSGVMVPVYAFGPGAEAFTGIYENTDIFEKIKSLLKL